ncbi:5-(carboxyamino)imidazole ribonucleotide synthase [Phycicoccus sp. MAQZ13P-2]|uniref:5-(carboxyamino)imidazole ribonucleotide synthase n=1 Tax=Phycicoccus mangrovi TaxID=2840470 RepID=UPI001C00709F|nr:5-(carboxyamino)imidazole ribonucleotide synthase [Phycicoccus mangrovi]MBT9257935.1 5-(carboxyamino)imidazole ribonucleotide synthase [Phycicoccus mangrovi]MBT9276200.1 5-(carboxyamino)imidazole ribonucleotide synthase [Phycicoccus mangrovi]
MTTPRRAPGGFPVVGIVGGGQLARMCAGPAAELGLTLSVLAEAEDASAALVVPSSPVGHHTDAEAVLAFAEACDVVTFDHEHVPPEVLEQLVATGVPVHPTPDALRFAQDKLAMRERLTALGVPCPRWTRADTAADVEAFAAEVGWPLVAKTPRGGYDGKGVAVVSSAADLEDWLARAQKAGTGLLLEEKVPFRRELAVLLARSPSGQAAAWPVVETVQTDGICTEVLAPAPALDADLSARAVAAALRVAGELGVTGVLAVELFEVEGEGGEPGFVVNELAMRPHNSGHWSMDGAVTGQFEQHLRAVLDLPLGSPRPRSPWTVMANVLGGDYPELYPAYRHVMARDPDAKVHLYGKGVRPGRKIGHVNVSGDDLADLRERAGHAADYLQGVVTE